MDVMRADERKIFATTKAKSKFSNAYSCCRSLDDIMRATDVVLAGSAHFLSGFSGGHGDFFGCVTDIRPS